MQLVGSLGSLEGINADPGADGEPTALQSADAEASTEV